MAEQRSGGMVALVTPTRPETNLPTPWVGLEQRINAVAFMLRVAVLAIGLLRAQEVAR